jgi:hypothetical protein
MFRFLTFILILLTLAAAQAAPKQATVRALKPVQLLIPGEKRPLTLYGESHALVIGASAYQNGWPRLSGVPSDVEAISKALERQGFKVQNLLNPSGDQLYTSLKRFIGQYGQARDSRLLIYYAH